MNGKEYYLSDYYIRFLKEYHTDTGGCVFVLLKLTDGCNMACSYCCMDDHKTTTMPLEDAIAVVDEILHYFTTLEVEEKDICFHGGEPSLLKPDYLRTLFQRIRISDESIAISMQTNLFQLSEELLSVLIDYKVKVSTSIDGPENVHNVFRKDKNGNGTFSSIMENLNRCKEAGIDLGLICTLNSENSKIPDKLYSFFKDMALPYKINWVHKVGHGADPMVHINNKTLSNCIITIIESFLNDENPEVMDDTSLEFMIGIISGKMVSCSMKGSCQKEFICVEANANVYPCDAFSYLPGAKNFCYGNVLENGQKVFQNATREILARRGLTTISECSSCQYSHLCHGGCILDARTLDLVGTKSSFCEAYQDIFNFCTLTKEQNNLFI